MVARVAGISVKDLWVGMQSPCADWERDWTRKAIQPVSKSLVYDGAWPMLHTRMVRMVAACLRNYLDARILTFDSIINADERPDPTFLLAIPDFWSKDLKRPDWQMSKVFALVQDRWFLGRKIVLHVGSMQALHITYPEIASFLNSQFDVRTYNPKAEIKE